MAQTQTKAEPAKQIALPEGRIINHSLFKRDQFNEEAKPSYKIELAFPKEGGTLDSFMEELLAKADDTWPGLKGKDAEIDIDDGNLISGILDGDVLAARREEKGKKGDAYKGMWVIRANTQYNLHGVEGEGGVAVYDEAVELIQPAAQGNVYNGCYGIAAVTIGTYTTEDKRTKVTYKAMKCYLSAFQKTKDGEKLVSQADHSKLFKPVGRTAPAGAETGSRRSRKG